MAYTRYTSRKKLIGIGSENRWIRSLIGVADGTISNDVVWSVFVFDVEGDA